MNSDLKEEGQDKVEKKVGQPDWYQVVSMLHLFRDSASKEGQVLTVGCSGWCILHAQSLWALLDFSLYKLKSSLPRQLESSGVSAALNKCLYKQRGPHEQHRVVQKETLGGRRYKSLLLT